MLCLNALSRNPKGRVRDAFDLGVQGHAHIRKDANQQLGLQLHCIPGSDPGELQRTFDGLGVDATANDRWILVDDSHAHILTGDDHLANKHLDMALGRIYLSVKDEYAPRLSRGGLKQLLVSHIPGTVHWKEAGHSSGGPVNDLGGLKDAGLDRNHFIRDLETKVFEVVALGVAEDTKTIFDIAGSGDRVQASKFDQVGCLRSIKLLGVALTFDNGTYFHGHHNALADYDTWQCRIRQGHVVRLFEIGGNVDRVCRRGPVWSLLIEQGILGRGLGQAQYPEGS